MISPALANTQLQVLLSVVPGLPLVMACSLVIRPLRRIGLRLAPWSALPALGAALFLKPGINLEVVWFFMGGRMGLDLLGQRFLLLAALVWSLAAFFARTYLRNDPRRVSFFLFYLASMAFNFGLILAQDMLGFYLFFGLMSFSAYGLIVHKRSREARQAGRVYIVLVMVGEVLLFSGMVLMASRLPDLELTTIASSRAGNLSLILLFIGFAIKAGALPLHVWLPLAHPVAPVPASAVLSGVMIKAGLLGWLRFLPVSPDIFLPGWGPILITLGLLAAFYGVGMGLLQEEAKTVLAYSSISQMGLMTMIVGCGLLVPALWFQVKNVVSIYVLHHGLAKAALFLATGVVRGGNQQRPASWLLVLVLLPSLALAGLPFTSGAIAKFAVKEIVHLLPPFWAAALGVVLPLAALATMLLICHFLRMIAAPVSSPKLPVPTGMLFPWLVMLAVGTSLLWLWPQRPEYAGHLAEVVLLGQGLWPVLVGGGLMLIFWKWWPATRRVVVPAGDILWLVYGRYPDRLGKADKKRPFDLVSEVARRWQAGQKQVVYGKGRGLEKRLMRWGVVGSCYLLLCLVFLFLLVGR